MKFATFMQIARQGQIKLAAVNAGLQKPNRQQVASIANKLAKLAAMQGMAITAAEIAYTIRKAATPNVAIDQWGNPVRSTVRAAQCA